MTATRPYQNRTAIVYFGPSKQDYLNLIEAQSHREYLDYAQLFLKEQLPLEMHHDNCHDSSCYTIHSQRTRFVQSWLGEKEEINICRVRCRCCRAVFTVLPSFIMRYRRQDTDCLGKLLEMNLGMGLTQRETATIYSWLGKERGWHPGWIWNLVQWLGNLLPVSLVLMSLGLTPPVHLLSDEKFAVLNAERIYLFLASEQELIWYGASMNSIDEGTFTKEIEDFLAIMNDSAQVSGLLEPEEEYVPTSVNTDGCEAAQNGWQANVPKVILIECNLHGRKRVSASIEDYAKEHPNLSKEELQTVKDDLDCVLTAPSLSAFSQRVRRNLERYQNEPILVKRLNILKQKRFLFTNHFKVKDASAYSAPLDRSMRFLDEKLQTFGQFRGHKSIDPMLNAWAIVNNLRAFLPDAKKAGQSLAEFFGAKLKGISWMEALNLCTVGNLDTLIPAF